MGTQQVCSVYSWMTQGCELLLAAAIPAQCMLPRTVAAATTTRAAVQVVATHLPPEEIEGIRQMFMDMDRDGSGTISYAELKEGERGWDEVKQQQQHDSSRSLADAGCAFAEHYH
jgi:hypothetical protein